MLHRRYLYFLTRGKLKGAPYIDMQLRPTELAAIGRVTTQWAFLEFLILREARRLAKHLDIPLPEGAETAPLRKRRKIWETLSRKALAPYSNELARALDCISRATALAPERNRLTRNIIEYDPNDPIRLKTYPRSTLGQFGMPLDVEKIEKTAHDIARLNHDILSIHSDPEPAPGASQRTRDKRGQANPLPASDSPGRPSPNWK